MSSSSNKVESLAIHECACSACARRGLFLINLPLLLVLSRLRRSQNGAADKSRVSLSSSRWLVTFYALYGMVCPWMTFCVEVECFVCCMPQNIKLTRVADPLGLHFPLELELSLTASFASCWLLAPRVYLHAVVYSLPTIMRRCRPQTRASTSDQRTRWRCNASLLRHLLGQFCCRGQRVF